MVGRWEGGPHSEVTFEQSTVSGKEQAMGEVREQRAKSPRMRLTWGCHSRVKHLCGLFNGCCDFSPFWAVLVTGLLLWAALLHSPRHTVLPLQQGSSSLPSTSLLVFLLFPNPFCTSSPTLYVSCLCDNHMYLWPTVCPCSVCKVQHLVLYRAFHLTSPSVHCDLS